GPEEFRGSAIATECPDLPFERRFQLAIGHLFQTAEQLVSEGRAEIRLEQDMLGVCAGRLIPPPEDSADLAPQSHQGSPIRRRHVHSAANTRMARAKSSHRSRQSSTTRSVAARPG